MIIPVAKPEMTQKDAQAAAAAVKSGWILQGPMVKQFEELLKEYIGATYAVATSSCTTAMHLGLIASGIGAGDEVIVPSMSYIASANCIVHAGATPVFADIDEKTYNIDPQDAEKRITKHTRAILAVHQIGLACDIHALARIAKKHNLLLLEDAACGLGSMIHQKHVGTTGVWGAFSFHPRKAITTAEGGLLVTNSSSLAKKVSMLRAHGAAVAVSARHSSKHVIDEEFPLIGYNFRMSDIHAAIGVSQFARIERLLDTRQRIASIYNAAFRDMPQICIPYTPEGYTHTYQSYMIRLRNGAAIRKKIMQTLLDNGIATRAGVMASHLEAPYRHMYPNLRLPVTEAVVKETLILPSFPQMTQKQQMFVIDQLKKALRQV
jgi:dTDP-4-amino-4,6-dideoxygalactose transaminase